MENLNAEQVKKALECCATKQFCAFDAPCPWEYMHGGNRLYADALALINSQEQLQRENERLRLKDAENATSAFRDTAVILDLQERLKKTTKENEGLHRICQSYVLQYGTATDKEIFLKKERAETVRKMHSMLCEGRVSNDNVVIVANQVAKEMLEGEE